MLCGSIPLVSLERKGILADYATRVPENTALAFETSSWRTRYLEWTSGQKKDKAIVDAALRINLSIPRPDDDLHRCPYLLGQRRRKRESVFHMRFMISVLLSTVKFAMIRLQKVGRRSSLLPIRHTL